MKGNYKVLIRESQDRCKELGLRREQKYSNKIVSDINLQKILIMNRNMIMTALPFINELIKFTRGSDFFVFLTDREGCILNAIGDEKILSEAFSLKMIPGAYMNEESIGTNAMSYVIKTGEPVQLTGEDHYIHAYHRWTCSAAPIKDKEGNVIGVIDLTGYIKNVHPHTLGIVVAVAKAIEEMLIVRNQKEEEKRKYNNVSKVLNAINEGIITSDKNGNIKKYNDKAVEMFGQNKNLKDGNMSQLVDEWQQIKEMLFINKNIVRKVHTNSCEERTYDLEANKIYNDDEELFEIVYTFREHEKINQHKAHNYKYNFDSIIGKDINLIKIIEYAKKIADSSSTVLIMGESGTGKELFAQSIYNMSSRSDGPFVAINCGAIPEALIESELFGYEDGAFTGARKGGNPGKFELAYGGTILLDEIGEMPLDMQVKLLRALEEGFITRLGGKKPIPVDVRIIASTNRDLEEDVQKGKFRKDLYYRLNVLPLYVPPLRERKSDIRLLLDHFMNKISRDLHRNKVHITEENILLMEKYDWPGNIRELQNIVELIVNTESFPIHYFMKRLNYCSSTTCEESMDMESVEKEHLVKIIKKCNGNITHSADILGIKRNTLYNKIKKYNIQI